MVLGDLHLQKKPLPVLRWRLMAPTSPFLLCDRKKRNKDVYAEGFDTNNMKSVLTISILILVCSSTDSFIDSCIQLWSQETTLEGSDFLLSFFTVVGSLLS